MVGPGLLVEPGLRLVGTAGFVPGVWKYSAEAKAEHRLPLQASTFQVYCLPALRLAVKVVEVVVVSTTKVPAATSLTATS